MRLVVGTYQRLGGAGLVSLEVRGDRLVVGPVLAAIADVSHGLWSPRHRLFYAVVEQDDGRVMAIGGEGRAPRIASCGVTGGQAPCHLALDGAERLLAAANYASGSVALFRLHPDGAVPPAPTSCRTLGGHGPHRQRQAGSHAHWVGFGGDGGSLYCVDLGGDRIVRFAVDPDSATLGPPEIVYRGPQGSGPRHLAFHPTRPLAWLVSELASTLTTLSVEQDGRFVSRGIVSTVPDGVDDSLGGAVLLDAAAARLYVTNRGHDSIATFDVSDDTPKPIAHTPSAGASPRFLLPLGDDRLLVANEEGGTVALFAIERAGLTRLDTVEVAGAVFLAPLPGRPPARSSL
jgi:6-phosphogluconolactonase